MTHLEFYYKTVVPEYDVDKEFYQRHPERSFDVLKVLKDCDADFSDLIISSRGNTHNKLVKLKIDPSDFTISIILFNKEVKLYLSSETFEVRNIYTLEKEIVGLISLKDLKFCYKEFIKIDANTYNIRKRTCLDYLVSSEIRVAEILGYDNKYRLF